MILTLVIVVRYLGDGSKEDGGDKALPGERPGIILISIDSLRPDHLKCYGYGREASPNIGKLAREGVLFKNAVSATSWTLPAHAAMFTGLYDSAHGVLDAGHKLSDRHITLPRLLLEAGYQTAGFFGVPSCITFLGLTMVSWPMKAVWLPWRATLRRRPFAINPSGRTALRIKR